MKSISFICKIFHIRGYYLKKEVDLSDVSLIRHLDKPGRFMFCIHPIQQPTINSCYTVSKQIITKFYSCERLRVYNIFKFSKHITINSLYNIFYLHNGPIIITINFTPFCNHSIILAGIRNEQVIFFDPWNGSFGLMTISKLNSLICESGYECA